MNLIDLMSMTGGMAPAADPAPQTPADQAAAALKKRMAGGADPVQSLDEVAKKFGANLPQGSAAVAGAPVVGSATLDNRGIPLPPAAGAPAAPTGGVGMGPSGGVGVGGPSSVADLTGPTVRSLAAALAPAAPQQPLPQAPATRTIMTEAPYSLDMRGQRIGGGGYQSVTVPAEAQDTAAFNARSRDDRALAQGQMPSLDRYLMDQTKATMSPMEQAMKLQPGTELGDKLRGQYQQQLEQQKKYGLDVNAQKISQQQVAAGLVGINVSHEGDAAKELGQASKNAGIAAYDAVKKLNGSDAEAEKASEEAIRRVSVVNRQYKQDRAGVQVQPGGSTPGVAGPVVAQETDPIVQNILGSSFNPQNGDFQPDALLNAYAGQLGKLTPGQRKGVAQGLAAKMGGTKSASQKFADLLTDQMNVGKVPSAGKFNLAQSADSSFFSPFTTYDLTAPGFKATQKTLNDRNYIPRFASTVGKNKDAAPTTADILDAMLGLHQEQMK